MTLGSSNTSTNQCSTQLRHRCRFACTQNDSRAAIKYCRHDDYCAAIIIGDAALIQKPRRIQLAEFVAVIRCLLFPSHFICCACCVPFTIQALNFYSKMKSFFFVNAIAIIAGFIELVDAAGMTTTYISLVTITGDESELRAIGNSTSSDAAMSTGSSEIPGVMNSTDVSSMMTSDLPLSRTTIMTSDMPMPGNSAHLSMGSSSAGNNIMIASTHEGVANAPIGSGIKLLMAMGLGYLLI